MKRTISFLAFAALMISSLISYAQPAPPYSLTIFGAMSSCGPATAVTVTTGPGVEPATTFEVPVNSDCTFNVTLILTSPQGTINFAFPCQGAIASFDAAYYVGILDSISIDVSLICNEPSYDCLGVPNGTALPGTACDDGDPNTTNDVWSANCTCAGTAVLPEDCLGVPGGNAQPGTSCDDGDPNTINDVWGSDCTCAGEPVTPGDCSAGFWVLQGYSFGGDPANPDSSIVIPIPNEVWVWNLSSGAAPMTFLWNFGDGTSSTEAFPSHVYPDSGPYQLCLNITDATGCTSSYCEEVSVDSDGIINGLVMQHEENASSRAAFTLNVVQEQPLLVSSTTMSTEFSLWPNPVHESINLGIKTRHQDYVTLSVLNMNGQVVLETRNNLRSGDNLIEMNVSDLAPGVYMLRIGNGEHASARRFVKH